MIGQRTLWTRALRPEGFTLEQGGRYLAFGHGGLVRRPAAGSWSGQGRAEYRTADAVVGRPAAGVDDAVTMHVRSHGPVTRHDIAWWSGLGLRFVDEAIDPAGRDRFADPAHLRRLWNQGNGLVLPPLMVDGRISGFWRAPGSARRRRLEVVWFARTRKPRASEVAQAVASVEAALDIAVTEVSISREVP